MTYYISLYVFIYIYIDLRDIYIYLYERSRISVLLLLLPCEQSPVALACPLVLGSEFSSLHIKLTF